MRGQFRLNSSSPMSHQHPFFFLTISIRCQEKRLRELIIKNDHQRENILIFYQIFSNILKGNVWRSVWRISIWIVGLTGGARVAQWWEHSPPTNVARVQIPASKPYVGWVCCWFSTLLLEVFLRVLRFSRTLKNNSSKFQFDLERILSAPSLKKLQLQKGKMRHSTVQTKYMPHVSDEVRTQDECLEMQELLIFTLHFTKRQKTDVIDWCWDWCTS